MCRSIVYVIIISELILILIILKITNRKNILYFYIFNLIRRFILFLSLFCRNYRIFCLGNIIKLGLFPFTYIILLFYENLNMSEFIMVNTAKLPYLNLIITADINMIIRMITIIYVIYYIYKTNRLILIISIYSVVSTVIILSLKTRKILSIYFIARLLRIYMCFICRFEAIRMYNLISLPLRLTFYIKIQFLLSLKFSVFIVFIISLTFITVNIVKYIIHININSKKMLVLLLSNTLLI